MSIVAKQYQHLSDQDLDAALQRHAAARLQDRVEAYQMMLDQDRAQIARDMAITRAVIRGTPAAAIAKNYPTIKARDPRCIIAAIARRFVGL